MYDEVEAPRYARIWAQLTETERTELRLIASDDGHTEPSEELVIRFRDAGGIAVPVFWEGAPGDAITRLDSGFLRWVHHPSAE